MPDPFHLPENFIAWEDVFGDPRLSPQPATYTYEGAEIALWDYLRREGLDPKKYLAVQQPWRYGWYLVRKDDGGRPAE